MPASVEQVEREPVGDAGADRELVLVAGHDDGAVGRVTDEPVAKPGRVIISFHPPPGEPNPDPW